MSLTATATALLAIAREAGAEDYDMVSGNPTTSKVARLRLPNGRPVAIQTNNKTPRIWMLADHEAGVLSGLGQRESYEPTRSRHHHLDQIREFRNQALVKVAVSTASWPTIKAALEAAGRPMAA